MNQYFPFQVQFVNGITYGSPEQMFQIIADFEAPELSEYKELFDKYGAADGLLSLTDITTLIIECSAPDLLDHMDFDEESYQLDMRTDSEKALQEFVSVVCPAFRDIEELERYVRRIADL
jgi:hypothetical protein